jgi:hypothetical protein
MAVPRNPPASLFSILPELPRIESDWLLGIRSRTAPAIPVNLIVKDCRYQTQRSVSSSVVLFCGFASNRAFLCALIQECVG